jgi:hypothetical protein
MTTQSVFNFSLDEASRRYPDVFGNYTYYAEVDKKENSACGPDGIQTSTKNMMALIEKDKLSPQALNIIFTPSTVIRQRNQRDKYLVHNKT